MRFLSIRNLSVRYEETAVFRDFNLEVEEGSIYCFVGPSGCGKSTLLKAVCGIIKLQKGEILLRNEPLHPLTQSIGYIPQQYGLLEWLTVKSNLLLGTKIRKVQASHADEIIAQLGIESLLNRYPKELSGGQQQRVALARAWMLRPELMLMDEPFSSLDTFTAEKSRDLFLHLWKMQKTTTLFVTHNLKEAVHVGKYIVLLSKQPAEIAEIIENPLFRPGADKTEQSFYRMEQSLNRKIHKIMEDAQHE
jgi:NitT/TauT family transport system ATP-binding protein